MLRNFEEYLFYNTLPGNYSKTTQLTIKKNKNQKQTNKQKDKNNETKNKK